MDDVVTVSHLCKSYAVGATRSTVLRDVSFSVRRGECLFLVGHSGSGKTTLLSILGCVLSADSGDVEMLGERVTEFSPAEQASFRRHRIGFVFQRYHLFEALNALENVKVPLDLLGTEPAKARRRALELLKRVDLADKARRRVTQLSMGQRQRVAIARALAANPDIVLADEPTASLDKTAGWNALETLKTLCREEAKTAIVVTHDDRILPLADRVLTLADGRLMESHGEDEPPAISPVKLKSPRRKSIADSEAGES
ncbi:MAG: ABC transporter ATP-binding protein [Planctomycetia bacterium]|nr:ABC transporter ATP-binding protein [Planctomycetia bacterium]